MARLPPGRLHRVRILGIVTGRGGIRGSARLKRGRLATTSARPLPSAIRMVAEGVEGLSKDGTGHGSFPERDAGGLDDLAGLYARLRVLSSGPLLSLGLSARCAQ